MVAPFCLASWPAVRVRWQLLCNPTYLTAAVQEVKLASILAILHATTDHDGVTSVFNSADSVH